MIEIVDLDEPHDTVIRIGCYRETWRLERVLRVFRKALTLAARDGNCGLFTSLIQSMHDQKGTLRVGWSDGVYETDNAVEPDIPMVWLYVERAWADENECHVIHSFGAHDSACDVERIAEPYDERPVGETLQ